MPWVSQNMHVTFGPEANNMPREELVAELEKLRADIRKRVEEHNAAARALDGLPYVAVPIDQLADIYERFLRLIPLGQIDIRKWDSVSDDVRELKRAVFRQADFGALHAGQWLPKEVHKQVYDKVKAELKAAAESTLPATDRSK